MATRAKSAIARIEFLLDERTDETVRVQFTEIESKKLARLYYGPHLVFVLAEADMNPLKNEGLDRVGERTKQQLAQLFRDHAAQQNLTRTLRGAAEATLKLAFFAIFLLFVERAQSHRQPRPRPSAWFGTNREDIR